MWGDIGRGVVLELLNTVFPASIDPHTVSQLLQQQVCLLTMQLLVGILAFSCGNPTNGCAMLAISSRNN
jgi:hypothetical protein